MKPVKLKDHWSWFSNFVLVRIYTFLTKTMTPYKFNVICILQPKNVFENSLNFFCALSLSLSVSDGFRDKGNVLLLKLAALG
jgi:hypothetical protein